MATLLASDSTDFTPARLRAELGLAVRARKPKRAIALLEQAVRRNPEDWKSIRHLAHLLTRVGRFHDAKMNYRRLAEHYEHERLITSAIAVWKIVLAIGPDTTGPRVKLGELYARRGLRADARNHYCEAVAGYQAEGRAQQAAEIEARIFELDEQSRLRLRPLRPATAAAAAPAATAAQAPTEAPTAASADSPGETAAPVEAEAQQAVSEDPVFRDDYKTRHALGIAYREMGLLDEAIAELQMASSGPDRLVECARLLAECFLEKKLPHLAVSWLERALTEPDLEAGQLMDLRYELAGALEARGDTERALSIYLEIGGQDPDFREVAERIRRIADARGADAGDATDAAEAERDSGGQAA
jgi:tetratricopeptide (TPR) repeat protein